MNKIFKEIHFLKDVLLPLLITISGIYIALLLNQWQNNQSDKNLKNIIQQQIKKEISENLKILIKTNNYHVNTQKQVLHYDSLGKDSVKQFFKVWKGLYPAFLKRTAFESANVSGVFKIFHYEDYHKISSVYTYQNQLEKVNDIYINNFLNLFSNSADSQKPFELLKIYLNDIINNEKMLIKNYEEWLKANKKEL